MRTITTALVGAGTLVLGASLQIGGPARNQLSLEAASIAYGPHPRDFVRIVEGTPFTVPAASFYVPTAVGGTASYVDGEFELRADGSSVAGVKIGISSPAPETGPLRELPAAIALPAGTTVTAWGGNGTDDARIWGYVSSVPALDGVRPTIEFRPGPDDMIAAQPFTVPAGKLCVVTAIGSSEPVLNGGFVLNADGAAEYRVGTPARSSMIPLPQGCVFAAGTVLSVTGPGTPRLWGYLADE